MTKFEEVLGGRQTAYFVCNLKMKQRVTSLDVLKNVQVLQLAIPCPLFLTSQKLGGGETITEATF